MEHLARLAELEILKHFILRRLLTESRECMQGRERIWRCLEQYPKQAELALLLLCDTFQLTLVRMP